MRLLLSLAIAFLVLFPSGSDAGPFDTISYQGVLTDPGGVAVPDASYSIRFRLYLTDGTTVVWEETQSVPVAGGRFNVALGAVLPLGTLSFDQTYLLGIKVGSDAELTPMTPLQGVPYSMRARSLVMAPVTRYHSTSAEAFTPSDETYAYTRNTIRIYSNTAGTSTFAAGLNLPHGARLTGFQALFEDLDATLSLTLALRRTNVATGTFQQIAAVASGGAFAGGLTLVSTSTFSDDIVDNQNWAYSLQFFYNDSAGSNLTLIAARVTYQVSEPLP
jgi:hypothetical protein